MPANFPAHLGPKIRDGTWTERRRSHFNEFETESGHSIRSKFPGSALTDCEGDITLSETRGDLTDLLAFYKNDCAEGATSFYMYDPVRHVQRIFQWASPPTISNIAGDAYKVHLSLIRE